MLFELPTFEHIDARDIQEVLSHLQRCEDKARVIAGGTDLLGLMKSRVVGPKLQIPEVLINVKTIPEMNRIVKDKEGFLRIGAAVTLNRLITADLVNETFSILAQAARQVGTTQLRNMGTLAGNICQRPRCPYFRHSHFICFKKGGPVCYAVSGEHRHYHSILQKGRCVMAHPSDMASVLVALKATAIITGSDGAREVPFEDFFVGPNNHTETVLKPGEFITEVKIPNQISKTSQVFLKSRIRHAADFALSSVAVVAKMSGEFCEEIRIVLGGIAPFPYVPSNAERMVKHRELREKVIFEAAEVALEEARALPMNHYKVSMTRSLVRRALISIWHT